jgi:hypothetical protein
MLTCWIFGHRYEYELRESGCLWLICTKCGEWKMLIETQFVAGGKMVRPIPSPNYTPSAPPNSPTPR